MKNTKVTWIGDIDAALSVIGANRRSTIYNDRHKTCRRLKFYVREGITDENIAEMQRVIQDRRPELNVTVSRWSNHPLNGWLGFGNMVVYYRPKTSRYMNY